jgi:hypothetical protein
MLADAHFGLDHGVSHIFRLLGPRELENSDPIKLLEVNPVTPEVGILPIGLGPSPARGILYSTIVVEVTPGEFERIVCGTLKLPDGWTIAEELLPDRRVVGAAS